MRRRTDISQPALPAAEPLVHNSDLPFRWIAVMAGPRMYEFPEKLSKYMRRTYDGPAIYAWRVEKDDRPSCVYFGQTENLIRRLRAYLKPGPIMETNLRLREYLLAELAGGAKVIFETLQSPAFHVNGFEVTMEKLGNPHVRGLLETMAILTHSNNACVVLNKGKDLAKKKREQFVRSIPKMRPAQREKWMQMWATEAGMI